MNPIFGPFHQVAYVTHDMDKALDMMREPWPPPPVTGWLVVRGDLAGPRQPVVPRRSWEARLAGRRRFGGELGQPGRG